MRPIDLYFLSHDEPTKSCLQFLRAHILSRSVEFTETWQYGMPTYYFKKKRICYLWVHKKLHLPYIGFVDGNQIGHPDLLVEKRARMKILLIDPVKNIPLRKINNILRDAIALSP